MKWDRYVYGSRKLRHNKAPCVCPVVDCFIVFLCVVCAFTLTQRREAYGMVRKWERIGHERRSMLECDVNRCVLGWSLLFVLPEWCAICIPKLGEGR